MKKIIIKLPDKGVNKFRLQRRGWKSRRYVSAKRVLTSLETDLKWLERRDGRKKTAIVIREHLPYLKGNKTAIVNETVASDDINYLLYATTCFLEDYLTQVEVAKAEKKYL